MKRRSQRLPWSLEGIGKLRLSGQFDAIKKRQLDHQGGREQGFIERDEGLRPAPGGLTAMVSCRT